MSLTVGAIQHLQKTDLLSHVNTELSKFSTKANLLALPDDFSLENLESFMPCRDNYRFSFATKSILDFGNYCEEFDKEGAKCFINSDSMKAKTIFDLGTQLLPLHQLHVASLKLDKTAAFIALERINGMHISQKDAANFIEDWTDNVKVFCRNDDPMTIYQASKQFREITIEQVASMDSKVDNFGESMSSMEKIEAKNKDVIPATIEFACVPYHGLSNRAFNVRVSIITGEQKPMISLRIVRLEAQEEDMAEEFKGILVDLFSSCELKTFIGEG
jgi:uncharacterized protein YfdQ (DUF2303 family)